MKHNLSLRISSVLGVVAAASGVALWAKAPAGGGDGAQSAAVDVEVAQPKSQPLVRDLRLPATLRADEAVDLFAKTSGYVAVVQVDIGDRVRTGDVLMRIDVPEMASELQQSQAVIEAKRARVAALQARSAQADQKIATTQAEIRRHVAKHALDELNLKRMLDLREGNAIPQQQLDEATSTSAISQAQVQIAEANVAGAESEKQSVEAEVRVAEADVLVARAAAARLETLMKYATISAPFDGVITGRFVDPGAFVRSAADGTTSPLLHLAKTDRIRLVLDIPESDVQFVRVGTKVEIEVTSLRLASFEAAVTRTAGALDASTRTMRVEADLDNHDGRLTAGMYARATVKLLEKQTTLMIPSKAIRVRGVATYVFVAENRTAKSVPVTVGYDDGIWAEITQGLSGGESVITATRSAVVAGTPVNRASITTEGH